MAFRTRLQLRNTISTSFLILIIIITLTLKSSNGITINNSEFENKNDSSSTENEELSIDFKSLDYVNYNNDIITRGFIYPELSEEPHGLSLDDNLNGIEDFIELSKDMYSAYSYIDTVLTLTQPASDSLIHKLESLGCIINHRFTIIDALGVSIPTDKISRVGALTTVEMVQSIHTVKKQLNNAVPLTKSSQDILKSNGYDGIDGEGVTIAVIDSGIDDDHNTFSNRVIAFKDFVYGQDDLIPNDGMDAQEYGYHGTMVASCAAGSGNYKGVAIKSNIISVAVDTTYDMIRGIEWCVAYKNHDFDDDGEPDGPDVITMSLGVEGTLSYLDNAAGNAMDNGVVFTTSAGNDGPGSGTVTSPATSPKVIAVGSTNKYNKQISSFSSRGPGPGGIIKPDVVAPGENLIVAYPNNQWSMGSGTSFSGPIVAGIAALILQYDPELDPYEVKSIILQNAEDLGDPGPDNTYGYGFVDTIAALDSVLKVKSLTPSPTKVIEDTEVTFSAKTSGANIKNFQWDFDGDGHFDKTTEESSVSHAYAKSETYTVTVKVTNDRGKTAENSATVDVTNRKPDAKLNIDDNLQSVFEDELIIFNGSKSWDTPSDIVNLEFSWSFNDGLNFTNFSKKDKIITHSFDERGEYSIKMKVRDDDLEVDDSETSISIKNFIPIADAGEDRIAYEGEKIYFSAVNTYDTPSDRSLLNYTWNFDDNSVGYGINVSHSYQAQNDNQTFNVVLTVKDDDGEKDKDTVTVTILNKPPAMSICNDIYAFEDNPIQLTGSGNDTSNDRNNLNYKWNFGDGNESKWLNNPYIEHTYTMVGIYQARLMVRDPKGAISDKEINVTISNVPPEADFEMDVKTSEEDKIVSFDASTSSDTKSDLDGLHYIWEFGDGIIATGKVVTHRYYKSYKYTIKLMVKDDDGDSSTITKRLTVLNIKPDAKLSFDSGDHQINEQIRFYGYKSTDTPSDKRNLTYQWDFGDGTHSTGINATHKYIKPGEYSIRLKVMDDDGENDETKGTLTIVKEEEKGDMFSEPTIENNGLLIYASMAVVFIILFLLLISLVMIYQGKKGIFGRIKSTFSERKARKEQAAMDEAALTEARASVQTGMTPEQEEFFTDMYGITPQDFMLQYNNSVPPPPPPQLQEQMQTQLSGQIYTQAPAPEAASTYSPGSTYQSPHSPPSQSPPPNSSTYPHHPPMHAQKQAQVRPMYNQVPPQNIPTQNQHQEGMPPVKPPKRRRMPSYDGPDALPPSDMKY